VTGSDPDGVVEPNLTRHLLPGGPRGAMIVCPGGAYTVYGPNETEPMAQWLNGLGIAAFVLRYPVGQDLLYRPLQGAARAMRLVRFHAAEWNIRPDKIGMMGFSAGGHVASTLATHFDSGKADAGDPVERVSSRPDALVLAYSVITMGEHAHKVCRRNLLGREPSEDLLKEFSNELHVTENTPPTFLWHAAGDKSVPVMNSFLFAEALSRAKVLFEFHVFPGDKHGAALAEELPYLNRWPRLCAEWLRNQGFCL
jgi:acetyl esterase/lipase